MRTKRNQKYKAEGYKTVTFTPRVYYPGYTYRDSTSNEAKKCLDDINTKMKELVEPLPALIHYRFPITITEGSIYDIPGRPKCEDHVDVVWRLLIAVPPLIWSYNMDSMLNMVIVIRDYFEKQGFKCHGISYNSVYCALVVGQDYGRKQ